jgi:hypothetical protein
LSIQPMSILFTQLERPAIYGEDGEKIFIPYGWRNSKPRPF